MHAATKERESQMRGHHHHVGPSPTLQIGNVLGTAGVVPVALSSSSPTNSVHPPQRAYGAAYAIYPAGNAGDSDTISLDMSINPNLEPYAITALLTDDLLPINTRSYSRDIGEPNASEIPSEGYIRQISSDSSKPQVQAVFSLFDIP